MTILALGFVLGMRHALDPDHVVAVSMIVSRGRSLVGSLLIGAFWGIGHTATLLGVGALILVLKVSIPAMVALAMELGVGIMLVFLGGVVAAGLVKERLHLHPHRHEDGAPHLHLHTHTDQEPHPHPHTLRRGYRSLAIGMVHGLAGSAALMLLIVANIDSIGQGLLYIVAFGAGSIAGMMLISTMIGLPFVYTAVRFSRLNRILTGFASAASIALGSVIIYEIGFVQGLFR